MSDAHWPCNALCAEWGKSADSGREADLNEAAQRLCSNALLGNWPNPHYCCAETIPYRKSLERLLRDLKA